MCKKVSLALYNKGLIEESWTKKPAVDISVHLADKGPMLSILGNNHHTSCILDSGCTYTMIPFKLWKKLNLNQNQLDTSVLFNINSASRRNHNAVLGQIVLDLAIKNVNGDEQLIRQKCLILCPELQLQLLYWVMICC